MPARGRPHQNKRIDMKTWQKLALIAVPAILIAAIGIWRINVARNRPGVVPHPEETHLSDEQMVQPRKLFIDDLKSAKDLIGKPVWVQAGYEMDYYPYAGHHVDFAHKVGVLPSVQRLDIKDIVLEKVPASVETRIPRGTAQAFAVFTMPGDAKEYATADRHNSGERFHLVLRQRSLLRRSAPDVQLLAREFMAGDRRTPAEAGDDGAGDGDGARRHAAVELVGLREPDGGL